MRKYRKMFRRCYLILVVFLFSLFNANVRATEQGPTPDLRLNIISAAYNDLSRIFSDKKGEMSDPDLKLVDQMDAMLGGPPDAIFELAQSVYFFSACRAENCGEKAAIIIDMDTKRMLGGAWRHFHCREKPAPQIKCDREPTVTIYYFKELRKKYELRSKIKDKLEKWGREVGRKYEEEVELN